MGITLEQAGLIRDWTHRYAIDGPVLTLGLQHLDFTKQELESYVASEPASDNATARMGAAQFFGDCGLGETVSVDVSDYEGADILFDLNSGDLPSHLHSAAGLVVNGGTLEHVFHVPNALSNITKMLKPGGCAIHILPCHNTVDHGFYQFGPTIIFDYYEAAHFDILECAGLKIFPRSDTSERIDVAPCFPGTFGTGLIGALDASTILLVALVRKTKNSLDLAIPTQRLYSSKYKRSASLPRWFPPFTSIRGCPVLTSEIKKLRLGPFQYIEGLAWSCTLAEDQNLGDDSDHPTRSQVVLFERGKLIGPAHTIHDEIKKHGGGAYSHWGTQLCFSTSDGTNPNENGYAYDAFIPSSNPPPKP